MKHMAKKFIYISGLFYCHLSVLYVCVCGGGGGWVGVCDIKSEYQHQTTLCIKYTVRSLW